MQENNYEYLSKQLLYTGFGDDLNIQLRGKMMDDVTNFALQHQTQYGRDTATATLNFRKSDESGMYFFNNYSLEVEKGNNAEALKQIFYINKGEDNITLKEAYNLLQGRAVHKEMTNKEGEKNNAWVQLDFKNADETGNFIVKKFYPNYGYNLTAALEKHPIKELNDPEERKRLMESLERGNRQSVTITAEGGERRIFVEAVPQFKSINIYDADMKRIRPEQKENNTASQSNGVKETTSQKQKVADEEKPASKNKGKSKRASIS